MESGFDEEVARDLICFCTGRRDKENGVESSRGIRVRSRSGKLGSDLFRDRNIRGIRVRIRARELLLRSLTPPQLLSSDRG